MMMAQPEWCPGPGLGRVDVYCWLLISGRAPGLGLEGTGNSVLKLLRRLYHDIDQ